jgi:Ca-activated chloride channel family protein
MGGHMGMIRHSDTRKTTNMMRARRLVLGAAAMLMAGLMVLLMTSGRPLLAWFITPDQQAQGRFDRGQFAEAAKLFTDSMRQGIALYRDGQFEAAEAAFMRLNIPEAHFNRGNALVMRGKYDDAIKAFEQVLVLRPGWPAAMNNLEIARLRAERVKREGGDMTGGNLGADEVVFTPDKGKNQESPTVETSGGQPLSDQEIQSMWLRRVQTKPADFLRAKFAFQLSVENAATNPRSTP